MIELKKSLWDKEFDSDWRIIPINTVIKLNNCLVMGAGLAKQAAERYPYLPKKWGEWVKNGWQQTDQLMDIQSGLLGVVTKNNYKESSSLELIEQSLIMLKKFHCTPPKYNRTVSPYLGCGLGGLDWVTQVRPLIEKYFGNDPSFTIVRL